MTKSSEPIGAAALRNLYSLLEEERILTQNLIVGAGTIVAGLVGVVFQAILSHQFRPSDYGDVFTVVTLQTLIAFPAGAFTLLIARETSRDSALGQPELSASLLRTCNRALWLVGTAIAALVVIGSSLISRFLGVHVELLLAAAAGIPFALALPLLMGEFQGQQRFLTFTLLAISQAGIRLVAAIALGVAFGPLGIIAGISLGTAVTYVAAFVLLRRKMTLRKGVIRWRPAARYLLVLIPSAASIAILLSSDVFLVKHLFPAQIAGEYSAVAALGRAIFWGATGVATVLFPKVIFRRTQGLNGYLLVNASLVLAVLGGLFGLVLLTIGAPDLLRAFAGAAYVDGAAYLPLYGLGMTLLGGVAVLNAVHQSRGKPAFLAVLIPVAILEPSFIALFHRSVLQVVVVVDVLMAVALAGLAILYVVQERVPRMRSESIQPTSTSEEARIATDSIKVVADSLLGDPLLKRQLRILILNWRCPSNPRAGGAERLTHEVARRLALQGHTVEWFSSSFPGASDSEDLDGFRLVRAGSRWTVYWRAFRRYRKVGRDHFDVIIDEVNVVPFFAPLWSGLPTFMMIHQLAREIWWYEALMPLSLVGFLLEPLYLRFYRRVPVLTVSSSTAADLHRLGFSGQVTVIPQGIEAIADVPASKSPEPTFLYVGRLVPSKRIEHIFLAFARFRQQVGAGRLWLVGSGASRYEHSLVRLARRLELQGSVVFWGRLAPDEKHHAMSAAHILLMTSVREGWGLVVTEANACGTPAIVYDAPGLRDSVQHDVTGLVVSPQPDSLAEAMVRVTEDQRLYSRLVAGARSWSATLTYDETARVIGHALENAAIN